MASLTSRQRAYLKSLAHPLKPVVQVGKDGVTATVIQSIEDAFKTRELLKVKVLESAPDDARAMGDALTATVENAQLVQVIGRTLVLYRPHLDEPEIQLPG